MKTFSPESGEYLFAVGHQSNMPLHGDFVMIDGEAYEVRMDGGFCLRDREGNFPEDLGANASWNSFQCWYNEKVNNNQQEQNKWRV